MAETVQKIIPAMNVPVKEDQFAQYWMEDDIIFMRYLVRDLDMPAARKTVHKRIDLFNGHYPVIVDISGVRNVPREVRQYLSNQDAQANLKAAALISNSLVTRTMFDFFVNFNKPVIPLKMFSNMKDALNWIEQYK
jgi:hypothetical protein